MAARPLPGRSPRSAGQPKGLDRLVRLHLLPPGSARAIRTVVDYDDGLLMHVDTRSFLEWYIFFYGAFPPRVSELLNRMLKPGQVAIDIGANIGMHSVIMANRVGPTGRVVCFEPDPHPYRAAARNLALNGLDWVDTPPGRASRRQRACDVLPARRHDRQFRQRQPVADNVGRDDAGDGCRCVSLDDFVAANPLPRLDVIKLLAQGEEWNVLQGVRRSSLRPKIFFLYEPSYWQRQDLT